MPGAGLSRRLPRKAPLDRPAFQPYWGKPAVRNERGDRGNVGIMRSPLRASILPNRAAHPAPSAGEMRSETIPLGGRDRLKPEVVIIVVGLRAIEFRDLSVRIDHAMAV